MTTPDDGSDYRLPDLGSDEPAKPSIIPLSSPVTYPTPEPLVQENETAAPYPLDALGDLLGGAAAAIAEIVQVPEAMAGQSILGAAAMAAQPHVNVHRDGAEIPIVLFLLTIAESGDRKSAADKLALRAHDQHQRELLRTYEEEARAYEGREEAHKLAKSAIKSKYKKDPRQLEAELLGLEEPVKPKFPFIFSQDPTLEGLQKSLLHGHHSQGLFSDEGGSFFGGYAAKPENIMGTVSGLSKLWDGSPVVRTRSAEGESAMRYGCRLTAHLMIQPVIAFNVLNNPLMQGQGFLPRFLIAWPESLAGTRLYRRLDPTKDARLLRYWERMKVLLEKEVTLLHGDPAPFSVSLDQPGMDLWVEAHDAIEVQIGRLGDLASIKATAGKAAENVLRIAGGFAVVEDRGTIGADLIERATKLVHWYLAEDLRLTHRSKGDEQLQQAQQLLDWLVEKDWQSFDRDKLCRSGPPFVRKDTKKRNALLGELVERRWLLTADTKTFKLHPLALKKTAKAPVTRPSSSLNGASKPMFGGEI
ncbi:YfjI family protein [Pseudomonas sp. OV226]|uniref:YfjI family protein n=1 Tax=Pseudomonas sp. OV226 TaxID=2135588 RepID=UPI000D798DB7|nr:YfjI family protein [Pseudomonas sp. OV226]PWK32567.1 uncharacterized protein DUF3987 [Pseudomonas sp. OV226]